MRQKSIMPEQYPFNCGIRDTGGSIKEFFFRQFPSKSHFVVFFYQVAVEKDESEVVEVDGRRDLLV